MIFPGFPGVPSFFQVFHVFQVEWEPWIFYITWLFLTYVRADIQYCQLGLSVCVSVSVYDSGYDFRCLS